MEKLKKMLNKKRGQVSDTITWIVATIIIVVILLIFVFASSVLANAKNLGPNLVSEFIGDYEKKANWIDVKTEFAYEINLNNKNKIDVWINGETNE